MPSRKNANARRQPSPESTVYFRPLLQLDSSPSWTAEHPSRAGRDRTPDPFPATQLLSPEQPGAATDDDDGPPTKHEGHLISISPTPAATPSPHSAPRALSPSPPTSLGHTRSPVLARPPTMLENFSRTVRNYVPASIPVPTAVPTPPRVSRPVSITDFMGTVGRSPSYSPEQETLNGPLSSKRRAHQSPIQPVMGVRGSPIDSPEAKSAILGPEDGDVISGNHLLTAYPTVAEEDNVLWSRWDSLPQPNSKPRRVLFLGYASGFQMWDCTNLASVSEVLNLSGPSWGHVTFAGVLPPPQANDDQLMSLRPLIGVVARARGQSQMLIYSLRSHEVVKQLPFHDVSSFASNNHFTVISTTNPPTLHVLSSASLTILHTISSSSIFAYSRTSSHKPNTNNTVLLSGIDVHDPEASSMPDDPAPVYSLSHRLLAFAAQPPRPDSPHVATALQPRTHTRTSSTPFGISQADFGNAAIKVGGTVLSGMKSLGGLAYNAAAEYAKSRSSPGMSSSSRDATPVISPHLWADDAPRHLRSTQGNQQPLPTLLMSGVSNLFFSRSAPAASNGNHDGHRRGATTTGEMTPSNHVDDTRDTWPAQSTSVSGSGSGTTVGSYVRVLDLGPLLLNDRTSSPPQVVTEFIASKNQAISHLVFAHDGNTLLIGPKDGQAVGLFQLRRRSNVLRGVSGGESSGSVREGTGKSGESAANTERLGPVTVPNWTPLQSSEEDAPWHVYSLRRGRTSAVIQDMVVSPDARWVAIGTSKGTVHVFAINPYGGQPDLKSHTDTKIWNVDKPQPLSVELSPIARLRSTRATGAGGFHSDLSFTFLWGSEAPLPTTLLPPQTVSSSPSVSSSGGRSDLPAPSRQRQHFKDMLVFDASGGVLSLRRITLEQRLRESSGIPFSAPIASLATSISLPGVTAAGRLSASPPNVQPRASNTGATDASRRRSGLTQQMLEAAMELVAKESTVATWQLKRRHDWKEVKRVVQEIGDRPRAGLSNYLAYAELSTYARSPGLVPRSIYLSHQFLFYTLGEDYHALIRQHRLAISGSKIDVRKEVEASAFANSGGAYFVETLGFPNDHLPHAVVRSHSHSQPHSRSHSHSVGHLHHHMGATASSFDEPLASAMSAEMEMMYDVMGATGEGGRRRVPIPMLPNGAAQQQSISWSSSGTRAALSGMSMGMGGGIPIKVMEGVGGIIRREMDRVRGSGRDRGRDRAIEGVRDDVLGHGERDDRVPLEFDEQDEDFGGEGVPAAHGDRNRDGGGDGDGGVGDGEDLFRAWSEEDRLAVDEAETFDDVLGIMDEDQVPAFAPVSATSTTSAGMGMGISGSDRW